MIQVVLIFLYCNHCQSTWQDSVSEVLLLSLQPLGVTRGRSSIRTTVSMFSSSGGRRCDNHWMQGTRKAVICCLNRSSSASITSPPHICRSLRCAPILVSPLRSPPAGPCTEALIDVAPVPILCPLLTADSSSALCPAAGARCPNVYVPAQATGLVSFVCHLSFKSQPAGWLPCALLQPGI